MKNVDIAKDQNKIVFKKLQLIQLSCLTVIWNLTLYPFTIWMKFKLIIYNLKPHDASILLDSF